METLREASTGNVLGTTAELLHCEMAGNGFKQHDSSKGIALFGGAISVSNGLLAVTATIIRENRANEGTVIQSDPWAVTLCIVLFMQNKIM